MEMNERVTKLETQMEQIISEFKDLMTKVETLLTFKIQFFTVITVAFSLGTVIQLIAMLKGGIK